MLKKKHRILSHGENLKSRLLRGGIGTFFLQIFSKITTIGVGIILARWLGAEHYGIYTSVIAILSIVSVPSKLGLHILTVRQVASYLKLKEWQLMRGLLIRVNQIVLLISLFLSIIGVGIIWIFNERLSSAYIQTLYWALAILPLVSLNEIRSSSLRGLHHVIIGQVPEKFIIPGLFFIVVLIWKLDLLQFFTLLTPEITMGLRFGVIFFSFAVGAWFLLNRLPPTIWNVNPRFHTKQWIRNSGPLLILAGMNVIIAQTDVIMLAFFIDAESAGIYRVASSGGQLVVFSLMVVNMAIQPSISSLYSESNIKKLQGMITVATRIAFCLAFPTALMLIIFGKDILTSVFGIEYSNGTNALYIIALSQLSNAGVGSVALILQMTGFEREAASGVTVGAVLNIILNLALIPIWGIEGAAIASGISLLSWNILLVYVVKDKIKINPTIFSFLH